MPGSQLTAASTVAPTAAPTVAPTAAETFGPMQDAPDATPVSKIAIKAVLDIEVSEFALSVDIFDNKVDMSSLDSLDPQAAAEVRTFAADVSSSFATSVSVSLEADADSVEVICLYKDSDATKLDLLELTGTCASSSALGDASSTHERRLQAGGFGIELQLVDYVVQAATLKESESSGQSAADLLASMIASTEILIESSLLPEGITVSAGVRETEVVVATEALVPAPAAVPSSFGLVEALNPMEEARLPTGSPSPTPSGFAIATLHVILILVLVIVLLVMVAIFGYYFFLREHMRKNTPSIAYQQGGGPGNVHVTVNVIEIVDGAGPSTSSGAIVAWSCGGT